MADEKEVLWGMYQLNMEQSRHHQDQRATATNIILVLAAGVISLITYDQKLGGIGDFYLACCLMGIGVYAGLWGTKHHERVAFFRERARGYRQRLDELMPDAMLVAIQKSADDKSEKKYKLLTRMRLWHLWLVLDLFIVAVGIILVVKIR
jgi:hypothetical protein